MLDPREVRPEQVTGKIPVAHLPVLTERQREFGYVPDLSSLRPGDLILTRTLNFNVGTILIEQTQRLQNPATAVWTHAAIYATDWRVFEATPRSDIASGNMLSWMPDTSILVRRPVDFDRLETMEANILGLKLVMEAALLQSKARYGLLAAGGIPFRLLDKARAAWFPAKETDAVNIICSGLYAKCFSVSCGGHLLTRDMLRSDEPITPSLLAGLETLRTVNVGWLELV